MTTESELTRDTLLAALRNHIGKARGITAQALCREVLGLSAGAGDERHLRDLVVELRLDGHHVCATTRDGYYLAATSDELDETCNFLHARCMSGLQQISAMKRVSIPDLVGQARLRL